MLFEYKLRFKNDLGNEYPDWDKIKFGDLITYTSNSDLLVQNSCVGDFKFITSSNVLTIDNFILNGENLFLSKDINFNLFLINGRCNYTSGIQQLTGDFDKNFMYFYLFYNKKYFERKYYTGSTIKHASMKQISNELIIGVSIEEQKKIGNFLSNVDQLIKFKEQEKDEHNKIKNYLLNN